jgi:hypothetical protein
MVVLLTVNSSTGVAQCRQSDLKRHLVGPMFLGLAALAYNLNANRVGWPQISHSVRYLGRDPVGQIVAGSVVGALLAHWFLD